MSLLIIDQKLFAGSYGDGIRVSDDEGETWTAMNNGLTNLYVRCFVSHNQIIYAGTHNGMYISNNNGINWNKTKEFGLLLHMTILCMPVRMAVEYSFLPMKVSTVP